MALKFLVAAYLFTVPISFGECQGRLIEYESAEHVKQYRAVYRYIFGSVMFKLKEYFRLM